MEDNNFCELCKSLLKVDFDKTNNKYVNVCYKCSKVYELIDSVIEYTKIKNDNSSYNGYILAAKYDKTYAREYKTCEKCKNNIMCYFMKEGLKKVYICEKCGFVV
jgi:DNA-directed RNA polymerase subunit M/transcription elongation factor TFIIS